eukprot:gene9520-6822_t
MSELSLESSRSSVGFSTARQSVGASSASSRSKVSTSNNSVKEYWNTKPLPHAPPQTFTFFKGPQPPSLQSAGGSRIQLDPIAAAGVRGAIGSPPVPSKKKHKFSKSDLLKPLSAGVADETNQKYELSHLTESKQIRLLKNLLDYVRFYAGHVSHHYRLDDVEFLIEHPVYIPIEQTQDDKTAEGLVLTLVRQFQVGKLKPLQWFDILTDWKKGFQQVMTYEEFSMGLNRYCDEKELPLWEEEDLQILFCYFLRSDDFLSQREVPSIRRHDFKIGFKKLHLSHRRKVWLNHQAKIIHKMRRFLRALRCSFRDFSVEYVMVQRHERQKREQQQRQQQKLLVPKANKQSLLAKSLARPYAKQSSGGVHEDEDDDSDDASVSSNASSQRGGMRRSHGNHNHKQKQHTRFRDQSEPRIGEPGYVYTAVKLQDASLAGSLHQKKSVAELASAALMRHCMVLPQLEATLSCIVCDFLIYLRTKNRDRVLRDYYQQRDGSRSSTALSAEAAWRQGHAPGHRGPPGHEDDRSVSSLQSMGSMGSMGSLLHGDVDDNASAGSLFSHASSHSGHASSTGATSHAPPPHRSPLHPSPLTIPAPPAHEFVPISPMMAMLARKASSKRLSVIADVDETATDDAAAAAASRVATAGRSDTVSPLQDHSGESSPEPFHGAAARRSFDMIDDYYFSTDAAAMGPAPESPTLLATSSSRPDSSASAPGPLRSQLSGVPTLSRRNSSKALLQRQASTSSMPGVLTRMDSAQLAAVATATAFGMMPPLPQDGGDGPRDGQNLLSAVLLDHAKHQHSLVRRSHGLAPTRALFQKAHSGSVADDTSIGSGGSGTESGRDQRERTKNVLRSSLTARASLFQQYLQSAKSDARLSATSTSKEKHRDRDDGPSVRSSHASKRQSAASSGDGASPNKPPVESEALSQFSAGMQLFQQKRLQQDDYRRLNDSFEKRVQFAVSRLSSCH